MRIPIVVKSLLIINILAFIADSLMAQLTGMGLSPYCALYYVGSPLFRIWQPLTYMFMHAGFTHIFFNMFALWVFGRIMEDVWGSKRFLIYYLVCGLGAALVQEICQAVGVLPLNSMTIGASGAVYGILLAFGIVFPNEKLFIIPIPIPIKAKYFVIAYIFIELMEGFTSVDGVAHFAHLGGMLVGFLLILYWKYTHGGRLNYDGGFGNVFGGYDKNEGNYRKKGNSVFGKIKESLGGEKECKTSVRYMTDEELDYEARLKKQKDDEEIDRILDKVRKSSYASLTEEEKKRLFDASNR